MPEFKRFSDEINLKSNSPTLSILTPKPTITSDFERTKANNKDLLISVERRYEARP